MSGETAFIDKTTGLWRNGTESEVREHNRTGYERRVKKKQERVARQGEDLRDFLNRLRESRGGKDSSELARLKEAISRRLGLALSTSELTEDRSKARNNDGQESVSKADKIVADMMSLSTADLRKVVRELDLHQAKPSPTTSSPNRKSSRGKGSCHSETTTSKAPKQERSRDTRRHTTTESRTATRPNHRSRGNRYHDQARKESLEPTSTQNRTDARGKRDWSGERGRSPGARELYRSRRIEKDEQAASTEERTRRRRQEEEDAEARKRFWDDMRKAQEKLEERLMKRQEESNAEMMTLLKEALARR